MIKEPPVGCDDRPVSLRVAWRFADALRPSKVPPFASWAGIRNTIRPGAGDCGADCTNRLAEPNISFLPVGLAAVMATPACWTTGLCFDDRHDRSDFI